MNALLAIVTEVILTAVTATGMIVTTVMTVTIGMTAIIDVIAMMTGIALRLVESDPAPLRDVVVMTVVVPHLQEEILTKAKWMSMTEDTTTGTVMKMAARAMKIVEVVVAAVVVVVDVMDVTRKDLPRGGMIPGTKRRSALASKLRCCHRPFGMWP